MKILYTGPRDIHATPALKRTRYATQRLKSQEIIVDWNDKDDVISEDYSECHFKPKKSIFTLILWQFYLFQKLLKYRPGVIFNMSSLSIFPIFIYGLFSNVKVVYDCRDYLAVSYKFRPWLQRSIQFFDNLSAMWAHVVVVPDEYGYEYFYMLKRSKLYVVHNTVEDLGVRKIAVSGPIRIAYFGYLSLDRNIRTIFEFVKKNRDLIELHIACNYIPDRLKDEILDLENIIFYGNLARFEAHQVLSEMDYCLIMYDPTLGNYKNIRPTKFYDCLALGLPFICSNGMTNLENHVGDSSNIAVEYGCLDFGVLSKTEFSQYNRDLYPDFSYEKVVADYRDFFEGMIHSDV